MEIHFGKKHAMVLIRVKPTQKVPNEKLKGQTLVIETMTCDADTLIVSRGRDHVYHWHHCLTPNLYTSSSHCEAEKQDQTRIHHSLFAEAVAARLVTRSVTQPNLQELRNADTPFASFLPPRGPLDKNEEVLKPEVSLFPSFI
jgi:hypothetical protein